MNKTYCILFFTFSLLLSPLLSQAQKAPANASLDQIVAVVNDHIILKSEVDQQVQQYMLQMQRQNQEIPFGKDMWYAVLQNIIDRKVMLDQAKIDSVTVSQDIVDQRIQQRIDQSIQQIGSEQALENQLGKSIIQLKADLRDSYREQMIVQKLQQVKREEIKITRPEVKKYFESIPEDSLPTIPEQVAISQIVITPAPLKNAREKARNLAEQLRDSILHHGKTIEEMARKYSDGPSASDGGKLPGMIPLDELVPEYSAAATALEPGEISKVVETSFGFHVIRLNKRVGDKISTNHILIEIDKESYNDQAAIKRLKQLKDSIQTNPDVTFADMARKYSEDPNTAPLGGRILNPQSGARFLNLEDLDPALYRIVLLLEDEGDISEPKAFQLGQNNNSKRAFRIVQLDQHVPRHEANLEQDYERIKAAALNAKRSRMINQWIANLREKMYIEYKIPIPEEYKKMSSL